MQRTLRRGHRGPDVQRWQAFLEKQGHDPGKLDGVFGERAAAATRAFQTAHGLVADGVVGPKTLAKASELGLTVIRRLKNSELSPALIAQAKRLLAAHHQDPYGTEIPFEIGGLHYVARIEEHYHPPGGPRRPWGYHPGVSLFLDTSLDHHIDAPDEVLGPTEETDTAPDVAPALTTSGVIVIDPGHGGTTTVGFSSPNNARSPSGVLEKALTLDLAERVRAEIAERAIDVRVLLTRTSDVNVSLADRAKLASQAKADAFLSLHFNGFDGQARGVEAHVRPRTGGNVNLEEDRRFAQRLVAAVHDALSRFDAATPNRGVKESNLAVLRDDLLGNSLAQDPCPACLLEVEFLDVPAVDVLFNTGPHADEVRGKVAAAIAGVLLETITGPAIR